MVVPGEKEKAGSFDPAFPDNRDPSARSGLQDDASHHFISSIFWVAV
jgi:hypothetical protein